MIKAVLLLASCGFSASPSFDNKDTLRRFLDALNAKSPPALEAFVKSAFDGGMPAEVRAKRLQGLVDQGAPFKLIRFGNETASSLKAVVEDRNREQLSFGLEFSSGSDPKIQRVMVAPAEEADAELPKDYSGWTTLSGLAAAVGEGTKSPAVGLAVYRNQKLESAFWGLRDVAKPGNVGLGEPWSVGSIGKPICTTMIARLIEDGKLRWDTTLGEALGHLPMKPEHRAITLEQLMRHRGGIPQDQGMMRADVLRIAADATDPKAIRENYARDILSRDLIGKPGEQFAYSNAGYTLLGAIAEHATGKPYETLVRELVFVPLGLKNSFIGGVGLPAGRPSGHVMEGGQLRAMNMSGPIEVLYAPAGGSLFMSVEDLVLFGRMHLEGLQGKDGMLKSATVKRLHKGISEAGGPMLYGCGWGIEPFDGLEPMHAHNGSNGTMRAQLSIFPKAGLVVACVVNRGGESEPSPPLQAVLAVARKLAAK